jgi:hypothetical protein
VPLAKLVKIAARATAAVKKILIEKLASRSDCLQLRLDLCDTDVAKLNIIYHNNIKDFS